MKHTLLIPEIVYQEIYEAAQYYKSKQKELEVKLWGDFEDTWSHIERNPFLFQLSGNNYRKTLLKKFPYLIIYKIYDTKILVYKFIHAKKHPVKRYK